MAPAYRLILLTTAAMVAFAANSVLCRLALEVEGLNPVFFTELRLVAGTVVLWILTMLRPGPRRARGSWAAGIALCAYATAFSLAYVSLSAGTGALLLFGAVQATMIAWGLNCGERMNRLQAIGLVTALAGLVVLLLPGLSAPPLGGAALMMGAGVASGVYSLLGRGTADPLAATGHNFFWATLLIPSVAVLLGDAGVWSETGITYALLSGGVASGMGYAVWYAALRDLTATRAATVQLSVPLLAALGGVWFLGEPISWRLAGAAALTLGGIALVLRQRRA